MKESISRKDAVLRTTSMIAKASAWLSKHYPYLSDTLYGLVPEPVFSEPKLTMGVTPKFVLYYNPMWMLNDPDIARPNGHVFLGTDIYHECNHILRNLERIEAMLTIAMQKGLSKKEAGELVNIAADIPINDDIDDVTNSTTVPNDSKLRLQHWAYRSETFGFPKGKTMEQYLALLLKNPQQSLQMASGGGDEEGDCDEQSGEGAADGDSDGSDEDGSKGGGKPHHGCGGIAGDSAFGELERELDEKFGRNEADQEYIRKSTYDRIAEHQAQKGVGSTPGFHLEDITFEKAPSKVNWKRELDHVVRRATGRITAGGADYSMRRPSRRSMLLGVLRPGLVGRHPVVAFIRDTSASMSDEDLNAANNEAVSVMQRLGLDYVWFLDADVEAYGKPERVRVRQIPNLPVVGRGGTNFIKPLQVIHKLRPRPDVCIYLTDGFGPAPAREPVGMKVVWCLVPATNGCIPAPWGHVVICSEDQKVHKGYRE